MIIIPDYKVSCGLPGASDSKESPCNAWDLALIPGLERPLGEGNGYPFQYSCLENSMERGGWWVIVPGVAKIRQDWVNNTFTFFHIRQAVWLPSLPHRACIPSATLGQRKQINAMESHWVLETLIGI